jgi:hypothetical protein
VGCDIELEPQASVVVGSHLATTGDGASQTTTLFESAKVTGPVTVTSKRAAIEAAASAGSTRAA